MVSRKEKLYNRFIVVNIDQLDETIKHELMTHISNWEKKETSVLENIYFWTYRKEKIKNPSTLLQYFIDNNRLFYRLLKN